MRRWVLLSADNVSTDIDIEVYQSVEDARAEMRTAWENSREEFGDDAEAEIDESGDSAYVYAGGDCGDMYYWQVKEIDFPVDEKAADELSEN